MNDISSFPSIFSTPLGLDFSLTDFGRAALQRVMTDYVTRDTVERIVATRYQDGETQGRQTLRVHYRRYPRGPRVVKFYYFVKNKHADDTSDWVCVGDTGARTDIVPPREGDDDIRWY